jgi:hypothetical protein
LEDDDEEIDGSFKADLWKGFTYEDAEKDNFEKL